MFINPTTTTKLAVCVALVQSLLTSTVSADNAAAHQQSQLRGQRNKSQVTLSSPTSHHRRDLASNQGTLTLHNNCGQDITNFQAQYNHGSSYKNQGVVHAGDSFTIDNVNANSMIHYYGLQADYDFNTKEWTVTEVASADTRSNYWTHVTILGEKYPFYMKEVHNDFTLNLCDDDADGETAQPPSTVSKPLTVHNNCGEDITHFTGYYNLHKNAETNWQTKFDEFGTVPIAAGKSVTIPNVDQGTKLHFYGLNAAFDRNRKFTITEVASAPDQSSYWTHVTFNGLEFDIYMKDIGDEWYVALCDDSSTTSTTEATTTTTTTEATTTTMPTTTSQSTSKDTLTIRNNCGMDITHFQAQYNVKWANGSLDYKEVDDLPIANGASITIENFMDGYIYFYGLNVKSYNEFTEVVKAPLKSNLWTHVTVNGTHKFPYYMKDIEAGDVFNLCG